MPIRVLTVDDSPFFLELLSGIIGSDPDLVLAGTARDGREAMEKLLTLSPDVVTLDVEMPVMDGLSTLQRIMEIRPTPVIMVSSHTRTASTATVRALTLGACDFVTKPEHPLRDSYEPLRAAILETIRAVARPARMARALAAKPAGSAPLKVRPPRIVVVGASTGGVQALTRIFNMLPARLTATIVAVQHMPGIYATELTRSLAETVRCPVSQPRDGEVIEPSRLYVAQGGFHLAVYGNAFRVSRGEPVNGHRPSIDVAMSAAARSFGSSVCGVLLTGIGRDGAQGIADIADAGGHTMAQDEATCVVFGMPRAAVATGKVDQVLPIDEIGRELAAMVSGR
jgi:two-component system, chemotaxis family, protein-glutamate methylesterase/glutaminase